MPDAKLHEARAMRSMRMELINLDRLGKNLIESATEFEMAAAQILASEADFLDKIICSNPSVRELLHANEIVCCVVQNLRYLEEAIVHKVERGMELPPAPDPPPRPPCPCPCFPCCPPQCRPPRKAKHHPHQSPRCASRSFC